MSTIQYALSSAILSDDAISIAKFMMMHAKKVLETKKQSPIDIVRNDRPLETAWNIADLYNSSNSSLWYLLLAWELKEKGNIEDAKKTLQKLVKKDEKLTSISDTFKFIFFEMLIEVYEIDKEIFKFLLKKLVNLNDMEKLCKWLVNKGYLNISFQVLQNIKYDNNKSGSIADIIAAIAETVAKFDDKDTAMRYIDNALELVEKMPDDYNKSDDFFLSSFVKSNDNYYKSRSIASIAKAVANFDDKDRAIRCIDRLVEIVDKMKDSYYKPESIASIAKAVANFDDKDTAMRYIDRLVEIVEKMKDDNNKSRAIAYIVQTQSKIRLFSDSIENIKKILVERDRYLAKIIYDMINSYVVILITPICKILVILLLCFSL